MQPTTQALSRARQIERAPKPESCLAFSHSKSQSTHLRGHSDLSQPTVDVDFHACDVGRILRGQKCHGACHFFRLPKALHRNLRNDRLCKFIEGLLWQPGSPKDRRDNWPRRNRVDADAAPRQLRGCCSCQRTQRRFGCRIGAGPCSTFPVRNAGIQDDRRRHSAGW
jgi:hypothetical protein